MSKNSLQPMQSEDLCLTPGEVCEADALEELSSNFGDDAEDLDTSVLQAMVLDFDIMEAESFKGKVVTMIRGKLPAFKQFLSDLDDLTQDFDDPDKVQAVNDVLYIACEQEAAAALAEDKAQKVAEAKSEAKAETEEKVDASWPGMRMHWKTLLTQDF